MPNTVPAGHATDKGQMPMSCVLARSLRAPPHPPGRLLAAAGVPIQSPFVNRDRVSVVKKITITKGPGAPESHDYRFESQSFRFVLSPKSHDSRENHD